MYENRELEVKRSNDRSFGITFAVVFAVLSAFNAFGYWIAWLIIAVLFAFIALLIPRILSPLNKLWFRFGLLIQKITNPIILGFIFFVIIAPIALLMRLFKADPLGLKFNKNSATYWIKRTNAPNSMKNQF
ncbi:hypothetical protein AGMMS50229_07880 [Campylobacterota bacterium]|nr:hypothetical protein AGMMS50229_07880 [Campylobacterota bacterium]